MILPESVMNTRTDPLNGRLVLAPGWATDSRIFARLQPALPDALTIDATPSEFEAKLLNLMAEKALGRISIMGWSIGGYLAADFALRHPLRVDRLFLLGVRNKYPAPQIEQVRRMVKRNAKAYLTRFYAECFAETESEARDWFTRNLLRDYLAQNSTENLLAGLDYLSQAEIPPGKLAQIQNVTFVHGTKDRIAPIGDVVCLQPQMPRHGFIFIENGGHAVFLNPGFMTQMNSPRREDAPPLSLENRGVEPITTNPPESEHSPLSSAKRGAGGEL